MSDYEPVQLSNEQSPDTIQSLSREALRSSWREMDIPNNLLEQTLQLLEAHKQPLHVSEIIRNVFGTPGIGQYSFYELRCRLNTACEQGLLVNLPHGKYALPVHHTSSSEPDDVLIHRIRQAGINPLSAVRSYSVRDKA